MKKHEELVIITKTYDLILWSCNHTGRFPRQHRFVLGERIERHIHNTSTGITRSQPAFGLQSQPELCQQAAGVTISPLRTSSQSAWFRGDMQGM